jgi:hypothetical protein
MMGELREEYVRAIHIGQEAERFFKTEVGRIVYDNAIDEIEEGHARLEVAQTLEDVRDAQNQVWRGKSIIQWISELIELGDEARLQLEHGNID